MENQYAIDHSKLMFYEQPKPVGYWVLYPGATPYTQFAMYKRPTDDQIRNTGELLGWGWLEAEPAR